MSRLPQIPPNPDTITQASLDSPQGWMDYPLWADVIAGDPKCRAKVLRTVVHGDTLQGGFVLHRPAFPLSLAL